MRLVSDIQKAKRKDPSPEGPFFLEVEIIKTIVIQCLTKTRQQKEVDLHYLVVVRKQAAQNTVLFTDSGKEVDS